MLKFSQIIVTVFQRALNKNVILFYIFMGPLIRCFPLMLLLLRVKEGGLDLRICSVAQDRLFMILHCLGITPLPMVHPLPLTPWLTGANRGYHLSLPHKDHMTEQATLPREKKWGKWEGGEEKSDLPDHSTYNSSKRNIKNQESSSKVPRDLQIF